MYVVVFLLKLSFYNITSLIADNMYLEQVFYYIFKHFIYVCLCARTTVYTTKSIFI